MSAVSIISSYFPERVSNALNKLDIEVLKRISEIRLRRDKKLVIVIRNTSYFFDINGNLTCEPDEYSVHISSDEFDSIFMEMCSYSVYSSMEQLKQGFFTLNCGARAGIAATAIYNNGSVSSVKDIFSINIRIPNDYSGCADKVLKFLFINSFPSIIVAGKPNSGKTTLLRDVARQLSSGFNSKYRKITIIDERFEFCGHFGNDYLHTGVNCDVISGYSKAKGIELATRSLSPEMIICDEVSTIDEVKSIMSAFSSGISFALSVHASDKKDLFNKPIVQELLLSNCFSYVVLLDKYTYSTEIVDVCEVQSEGVCSNSVTLINNGSRLSSD